jgi:hypothetical protein
MRLYYIVTKEEGFFNVYRRTIKKKLRPVASAAKSIKKLGLTDSIYYGGVSLFGVPDSRARPIKMGGFQCRAPFVAVVRSIRPRDKILPSTAARTSGVISAIAFRRI